MWSKTTPHKSKAKTHSRIYVQPYLFTCPYETGDHLRAKVCPELPDEICEPSSSALKKNNQTQREEFLSWQNAVITEVLLSSPSFSPMFSTSFSFPPLSIFLPTVSEGDSQACWQLSLGSMWPQEWVQQRKPEHSGVSRWILAFVPLQRAGFPFDTAA